jgi:uncharacterized protein (DUF4415 family)
LTISKKRLEEMSKSDGPIDYSDISELDEDFFRKAELVRPDVTQPVTLRIKQSVIDAFKADGKGYQTRMNAVLETYARSVLKAG